jgi:hypothetical protein
MSGVIPQERFWREWNRYQRMCAGMAVWTPQGEGTVIGKCVSANGMEVIVDHGQRVGDVVVSVAYSIRLITLI